MCIGAVAGAPGAESGPAPEAAPKPRKLCYTTLHYTTLYYTILYHTQETGAEQRLHARAPGHGQDYAAGSLRRPRRRGITDGIGIPDPNPKYFSKLVLLTQLI